MASSATSTRRSASWIPGVVISAAAALLAWGIHVLFPVIPLLTAAVALGIIVAQIPPARREIVGSLAPGLSVASKKFMRLGIVLLGLKLSLIDIAHLGWLTILLVVALVLVTFVVTYWLGRLAKLPKHEPLLIATGFSICGASAIGAMSGVVKAKDSEAATPVALVTLCGTLAIAVLPIFWHPLGFTADQFGHWVGASVHDVGQVVATAQLAGTSALAIAVVIKLTRVLMLAPMVSIAALAVHSRDKRASSDARFGKGTDVGPEPSVHAKPAKRPPIVPLFVAGFLLTVVIRSFVPLPESVLSIADTAQTALLAMALFGLGTGVRVKELVSTGWRSLLVGLASWALIAMLAYFAVVL
ncbi:MAG: putative sulfate exporter family transporter [Microbacteriaceae bacterium]|nr:putative sulfate exporter family transporter [Microbacteriaceae bacterium]